MSLSAQRAEIRDWATEMAGLLAGESSVAGWHDFLLRLADDLPVPAAQKLQERTG